MRNHIKLALRNYFADWRTWELFAAVAFVLVVLACCGCGSSPAEPQTPPRIQAEYQGRAGWIPVYVLKDSETGREWIVCGNSQTPSTVEIKPREEQ